jgi:hypothetical protein
MGSPATAEEADDSCRALGVGRSWYDGSRRLQVVCTLALVSACPKGRAHMSAVGECTSLEA